MSLFTQPTEQDTVPIHLLASSQTQLHLSPAATTTAAITADDWREDLTSRRPSTTDTLGNNHSSLESHGAATAVVNSIHDDDAITRHQIHPIVEQQQPSPLQRQQKQQQQHSPLPLQQQQQQQQQEKEGDRLPSSVQPSNTLPLTAQTTRSRTRTSSRSRISVDYSVPSFRLSKADIGLCADQYEAICEIHDHHGTTAFAEEEAALEYSAALTAARHAELLSQQRASYDIEATEAGAGAGGESGGGVGAGFKTCCLRRPSSCFCLSPLRPHHLHNVIVTNSNITDSSRQSGSHNEEGVVRDDTGEREEEEEVGEHHEDEDEEESDHFCSGVCLPRSQFFQTSVICSNTMARDALANERTFLSWLNVSMALSLVSFTFISKSLTLDNIKEEIGQENGTTHKDHLSKAVGYVCFAVAFLSAIYSPLKYLRNIRRISTRYPFAQAGAWTFTVGMIIGTIIMVALVLAYTMPV